MPSAIEGSFHHTQRMFEAFQVSLKHSQLHIGLKRHTPAARITVELLLQDKEIHFENIDDVNLKKISSL